MTAIKKFEDVLTFWFDDHGKDDWFGGTDAFDKEVRDAFTETLHAAEKCELSHWRKKPQGRLAEVLVLDQFSRQLYRGSPKAFANDALALALAQEAIAAGVDQNFSNNEKQFLYLPFMHSESLAIHEVALKLFEPLGEGLLSFETRHHALIERFGRYPMRNAALGRASTPEEKAYIAERGDNMF